MDDRLLIKLLFFIVQRSIYVDLIVVGAWLNVRANVVW